MTKISVKFIITVASIVFASVVIGLGILAINKIGNLNDEISRLNSSVGDLKNDISWIQHDNSTLKNEIQRQLEEQSRNYFDADYIITDINTSNNTATVEIYFSLKESSLSGEVDVSYGKGNQYEKTAATKLADGKYMAQIELQTDKDYEISYSVVLSGVKTEKLMEINILKQLENRFNTKANFSIGYVSDGKTTKPSDKVGISFWIINYYSKNDQLKVKTAVLEIYKDNTVIKTVDLKYYKGTDNNGYEHFGGELALDEFTYEDVARGGLSTKIKVVDNLGLEYTF